MPERTAWRPSSTLRQRTHDVRDQWRDNGFRGMPRRQRVMVVLASVVVLVLVASLLVSVVRSITAPDQATTMVDGDPREGVPAFAAGVTMARLVGSDPDYRLVAYLENVDPSISDDLRASFEPGITKILETSGAGADGTLKTDPLGYRTTFEDGRLVALSLWTRRETTPSGGKDATVSYPVLDVMMRWDGKRWVLVNYFGSEPGPAPEEAAAEAYTPLLPTPPPGSGAG